MSYRDLKRKNIHIPLATLEEEDSRDLDGVRTPVNSNRVLCVFNQLPLIVRKDSGGIWTAAWTDFSGFGVLIDKLDRSENRMDEPKTLIYVGQIGYSSNDLSWSEQMQIRDVLSTLTPRCIPVFVDADVSKQHYEILCKGMLWPLFHNIVDPIETPKKLSEYKQAWVRLQEFCSL